MSWKRVSLVVGLAGVLAAGSAAAAGAGSDGSPRGGERPTLETEEVSFTISWENCSELAPGTVIEGTGTLTVVKTERATGGGATATNEVAIAVGTASDQAGGSYSWIYDNRTWVSNTVDAPDAFAGVMVDKFLLSGAGPAFLDNGFSADFSFDASDDTSTRIVPWDAWGDPLDFEALEARCDPL